jgi:hypothetical protein
MELADYQLRCVLLDFGNETLLGGVCEGVVSLVAEVYRFYAMWWWWARWREHESFCEISKLKTVIIYTFCYRSMVFLNPYSIAD